MNVIASRHKRNSSLSSSSGMTLIEIMVSLAIFVLLAMFLLMAVREVVTQWTMGERRRALYEKAAGVVDVLADDIRLALSREPAGATEVKVRFIGDYAPGTSLQRLMFVRAFEAGPERAITSTDADGRVNELMFKPPEDPNAPVQKGKKAQAVPGIPDLDEYTGLKIGDYKALGGMAMVGFFLKDRVLYRTIHAPVPAVMSALLRPETSQILATDVLYLGFDYWTQTTQTWDQQPDRSKSRGPEHVWDSTRGITAAPLGRFILHRGPESLNDPDDDVFPEKVRVTVSIDSPMPRCVYTKLVGVIGETDGEIEVESTKGFSDGGDENAFILIEEEWIRFKKKSPEHFIVEQRGARGTIAKGHPENAVVRTGKTFVRVVYLPNWREDFTSDDAYRARKQPITHRRILDE